MANSSRVVPKIVIEDSLGSFAEPKPDKDELRNEVKQTVVRKRRTISSSEKPPEFKSWKEKQEYLFRNQKLPAWNPIIKVRHAATMFVIMAAFFILCGIYLIKTAEITEEVVINYSDCKEENGQYCKSITAGYYLIEGYYCVCDVNFTIATNLSTSVMMYYGLTDFFQNRNTYLQSVDHGQLRGNRVDDPASTCGSYQYKDVILPLDGEDVNQTVKMPIAPCGAMANAMFNDTFELFYTKVLQNTTKHLEVPLLNTGIAWDVDKQYRYRNPPGNDSLQMKFAGTTYPPSWHKPVYELDPSNPSNNGFQNEDFIVWMSPAAASQFKKPHRRIDYGSNSFIEGGLPAGDYVLRVKFAYPMEGKQQKYVILARSGVKGGYDSFIGTMCVITGSLCFLTGAMMSALHWKYAAMRRDAQNEIYLRTALNTQGKYSVTGSKNSIFG